MHVTGNTNTSAHPTVQTLALLDHQQRSHPIFNWDRSFPSLQLLCSSYMNVLSPKPMSHTPPMPAAIFYVIKGGSGSVTTSPCAWALPSSTHSELQMNGRDLRQPYVFERFLIRHLASLPVEEQQPDVTQKSTLHHLAATDHCRNAGCAELGAASCRASEHRPNTRAMERYVLQNWIILQPLSDLFNHIQISLGVLWRGCCWCSAEGPRVETHDQLFSLEDSLNDWLLSLQW